MIFDILEMLASVSISRWMLAGILIYVPISVIDSLLRRVVDSHDRLPKK